MAGVDAVVWIAAAEAVIGGLSAWSSSDAQRRAMHMQQDANILSGQQTQRLLDLQNEQNQLQTQALLDKNYYEQSVSQMQEMRYGLLLEQYGLMSEIATQKYALESEIYEWQIATLDWEAGFKETQAQFLDEKGQLARELFGQETAKLLARERAKKAASGIQIGTGSPVEVLGQLAGERQFASDIMKWETDVDVYEKRFEGAQLLNEKNKVRFGEYSSALDYSGTMGDLGAKATEAGGMLSLARMQTGLLGEERNRISLGADIDLRKYNIQKTYGGLLSGMQSSIYGSAASAATTGGYLQAGASVFNSFRSYYTMKSKAGDPNYHITGSGTNYYGNES